MKHLIIFIALTNIAHVADYLMKKDIESYVTHVTEEKVERVENRTKGRSPALAYDSNKRIR